MTRLTRTLSALLVAGVLAGAGATTVSASAHVVHADGPVVPTGAFDWE